ncbi:type II toxin-antitoxin system VapB family antitoxin [Novosphingobium sp. G106]|uniref:type II toxin-antitoxin system VapB family antitoxin n=1 Tax=Novosphingobium sp. G106 TaxID=2849500 RepID=UPI001C2CF919|nr:type II toxin-antitoxin system VapB family antitoxin [Novosphingobium sp. G106]MBV1686427.1 type II toxin-antitoxin system VapB family antitoxin [Novosphingobium sp. G106]
MALYVKDDEVDRLADRVATLHRVSKTEAVRRALMHELEREGVASPLVERGMAFVRALRKRAGEGAGQPADKAFIDSLYSDN